MRVVIEGGGSRGWGGSVCVFVRNEHFIKEGQKSRQKRDAISRGDKEHNGSAARTVLCKSLWELVGAATVWLVCGSAYSSVGVYLV